MRVIILYGSEKKLTGSHKRVTSKKHPAYYVRAEFAPKTCTQDVLALDRAKALPGEVLLNTEEIA
jgi:hypothetical protein